MKAALERKAIALFDEETWGSESAKIAFEGYHIAAATSTIGCRRGTNGAAGAVYMGDRAGWSCVEGGQTDEIGDRE
jgi:hypothetical protein